MTKKTSASKLHSQSDGSQLAQLEFAEASKTTGLFCQRFKQIMGSSWDRKRLDVFRRRIIRIIRSGPAALTGQRRFWDGDISQLLGYELNPRASVSSIFYINVAVTIEPLREVQFKIPAFRYEESFKHHKDAECAELKLYFLAFNLADKTFSGKSIIAFSQKKDDNMDTDLNINLPIKDVDNQVVMLIKHIYFKRADLGRLSEIRDMRYMGAQIISIAYIKNGTLASFNSEKKEPVKLPKEKQGIWLNID